MRGFSTAAVWLRLLLANDAQEVRTARLGFNVTWLQHVDFHSLRTRDGRPAWHAHAGRRVRPDGCYAPLRSHPAAAGRPAAGESVQVLLRVMSAGQIRPMMELRTEGRGVTSNATMRC
ncbi:7TM-DISM domain-containing protein [Variovorax paradoxus]|uniref:7TM-DISM domain-containing protein n=1 Tax=Variovorax paradoxus TaxID=34073 RepID=UPI003520186D